MSTVSVVLATYGGERYLEEQLLSLLNQTRPADEVIICDDCSTDNTAQIAENFIEKHQCKGWCFLCCRENVGFIKNFRRAMEKATGDIVFLCDQDDVWCEDKIEKMCQFFEEHPDALSLCTALCAIDENGKKIDVATPTGTSNYGLVRRVVEERESVKITLPECMKSNVSAGCTMALRGSLVKEYAEKSDCGIPHDQELNLIAAERCALYFLNLPLTLYRLHENNTLGFKEKTQSRADIAREKYEFSLALSRYGTDYSLMFSLRADALAGKKLFKTARLILNRNYRKFFSLREFLGDILYCLR